MRSDELKALREQKATLVTELRSLNEAAQARAAENDNELQAEDIDQFKRLESDLTKLHRRIETAERTAELTRWEPDITVNMDGAPKTFTEYRQANAPVPVQDTAEVRNAIYSMLVKGKENLEPDEYRAIGKATSGGGFLVPTDMAAEVVRSMRWMGSVGDVAREIVTSAGETFLVPTNLTHGSAAWLAEAAAFTPSDEVFTQASLSAFKAGTKVIVSEELLQDSAFDLASFLGRELGERLGVLAEDAYINGDGTGKPAGLLHASQNVPVTTLAAGQVTTLTYAALTTALFSLPVQYRQNASILVSDSALMRLYLMADTAGNPIWNQSLESGGPSTFLGYRVYTHPNLPATGANAKTMIVGDFSRGYWIRRVNGVFMQRQNELHSDNGQVGFRGYVRVDGRVVLPEALRVIAYAAT
jgi:HK97 family phage major capsid protein